MRDVVKKEVLKLLKAGVIYPISDSEWVSPVQVVLKKGGMMVIHNEKNELIPQRIVTDWWMCINYRKLNKSMRKDHFPLPFIDEMLESLLATHLFAIWMVTLVIIRSRSIQTTRARPPSHVHMALSHTGECHLDCVMLQHHFKGA
jgi:hypothetical protein